MACTKQTAHQSVDEKASWKDLAFKARRCGKKVRMRTDRHCQFKPESMCRLQYRLWECFY